MRLNRQEVTHETCVSQKKKTNNKIILQDIIRNLEYKSIVYAHRLIDIPGNKEK